MTAKTLVVALVAACLLLAACGGDDEAQPEQVAEQELDLTAYCEAAEAVAAAESLDEILASLDGLAAEATAEIAPDVEELRTAIQILSAGGRDALNAEQEQAAEQAGTRIDEFTAQNCPNQLAGGSYGNPRTELDEEDFVEAAVIAADLGLTEQQFNEYVGDVDLVIEDLDTYWSRTLPNLAGVEHVTPAEFIRYTSSSDAPVCGGETLEPGNAFYCIPDNYIAWDEANLLLPYFAQVGDFSVAYVLAHEWGHSIQSQLGARARFTIQYELQADCYAGAWAGDADVRGLLEEGDIDEGLVALRSVADLKGTPWTDPQAHGTAQERIGSFAIGFDEGPRSCRQFTD